MRIINPRERLSPEDYLYLFWFEKISSGAEIDYADFQPTESLIYRYNDYVKTWNDRFLADPIHYEKPVDWDVSRKKHLILRENFRPDMNLKCGLNKNLQNMGVSLAASLMKSDSTLAKMN